MATYLGFVTPDSTYSTSTVLGAKSNLHSPAPRGASGDSDFTGTSRDDTVSFGIALLEGGGVDTKSGSADLSLQIGASVAEAITIGRSGQTATLAGNVVVTGTLQVDGTTTTINSASMDVDDNIIMMNADETASTDGGIAVGVNGASDELMIYDVSGTQWVLGSSADHTVAQPTIAAYTDMMMGDSLIVGGTNTWDTDRDATITFQSGDGAAAYSSGTMLYHHDNSRFQLNDALHVTGTMQSTGSMTVDTGGLTVSAGGASVDGGLTLLTTGVTATGLNFGGAATEIGDVFSDGFLRLGQSAGDPTNAATKGFIYTKNDGGDTELYYLDAGGLVVQITKDGAINADEIANSLDDAYDDGRTITMDAGPLDLNVSAAGGTIDIDVAGPVSETAYQIDIEFGTGNWTGTPHGMNIDYSGVTSLSNATDIYGVLLEGATNGGAGSSVGISIDANFDKGLDLASAVHMADSVSLYFGTGDDIDMRWDGTDMDVLAAADDSAWSWGNGTNSFDMKWYGNTASELITFDASADKMDFDGIDLQLKDSDLLSFGDGDDVTISWDGTDLDILAAADDSVLKFGNGTNSFDVWFYGDTASDTMIFDASAKELSLNGVDLIMEDDDLLYFGAGKDFSLSFDNATDGRLELLGKAETAGDGTMGLAWFTQSGTGSAADADTAGAGGGDQSHYAGTGGAASASAQDGGAGGTVYLYGGTGGAGATGQTAGAGGNVYLTGGTGGAASGGTQGAGGAVFIEAGNGVLKGTVSICSVDGTDINLGNATDNTVITQAGSGQVTFSGNVDATAGLDVSTAALTASAGATFSSGEVLISGGNAQLNDGIVLSFGDGDDISMSWDNGSSQWNWDFAADVTIQMDDSLSLAFDANTATGEAGHSFSAAGGAGTVADASNPGGAGGTVTNSAGVGGAADSNNVAGAGGAASVLAGDGGASSATLGAGIGGDLQLNAGTGGDNTNGGGGANGGNVTLDAGAATGAATNGTISLGETFASAMTLGASAASGPSVTVKSGTANEMSLDAGKDSIILGASETETGAKEARIGWGTSTPADSSGYGKGSLFMELTGPILYINTGTEASVTWTAVGQQS